MGQLASLQSLEVRECSSLAALPESLGQLAALRELDVRGCTSLAALPASLGQLESRPRALRLREDDLESCRKRAACGVG